MDFAPFVSATKLSWVIEISGWPRSSYFRLFLDWSYYQEESQTADRFQCADRRQRAPLMSMNLFTFDWKAQGAIETREGEVSSVRELKRWTERNRNFIPVTFTIGQTARYWPRECQPLTSTVRLDGLTVEPFLPGMDHCASWTTLSREGERWQWDHLTSRGQGHGYSFSIVLKV